MIEISIYSAGDKQFECRVAGLPTMYQQLPQFLLLCHHECCVDHCQKLPTTTRHSKLYQITATMREMGFGSADGGGAKFLTGFYVLTHTPISRPCV